MQTTPVILFRKSFDLNDQDVSEEYDIAKNIFPVFEHRTETPNNTLVIGRYAVLPYYKELEQELSIRRCNLINSYEQHRYIADITQYTEDLGEFTPKTYTFWEDLSEGKWIVKGKTNSRKFHWNTHMYAEGREQLLKVVSRLMEDTFISEQGLVVREYVPLEQVDMGLNGMPVCKEWRCFFYKDTLLASGYYWASYTDNFNEPLPEDGVLFAEAMAKIIGKKCNFFVLDIAKKASGGYIVIEANDAQMSGLSLVDAEELYTNLKTAIQK